jgi:hypothetical protein
MSAEPVAWLGRCDKCGETAPEERLSEEEAEQDAADCPCTYDHPSGENDEH